MNSLKISEVGPRTSAICQAILAKGTQEVNLKKGKISGYLSLPDDKLVTLTIERRNTRREEVDVILYNGKWLRLH